MRRITRVLATLLLATLVVLGVLVLARNRLGPGVLEWALERYAGLEAEIESTSGPWSSSIRVRGLVLRSRADPGRDSAAPVRALAIGELELEYDLLALVRGELSGLQSVRAARVAGTLDLSRSSSPAEPAPAPRAASWPQTLPRIALEDVDLELVLPGARELAIVGGRLEVTPDDGGVDPPGSRDGERTRFVLDVERARYGDDARTLDEPVRARFTYVPGGLFDVEEIVLGTRITLRSGRLDLTAIAAGRAAAETEFDSPAGRGHASAVLADRRLDAAIRARQVELDKVSALAGLAPESSLEGTLDVEAELALPLGDWTALSGSAEVEIVDPAWRGRRAELLRGRVVIGADAFEATDVVLVQAPNEIEIAWARVPRRARVETGSAPPASSSGHTAPVPLPPVADGARAASGLCALWEGAQGAFELDLEDVPALLEGAWTPEAAAALPAHRLTLAGEVHEGVVVLARGELATVGGSLVVERGRVPIVESVDDLFAEPDLDLSLRARFEDLAPLGPILRMPEWEGALDASVHVRGGARGPLGAAEVRGRGVAFAGRPLGELELDARIDRERVVLDRFDARGDNGTLACRARFDFADRRLEIAELEADVRDLSLYAPGVLPEGAVRAKGSASGTWPDLDLALEVRASEIVLAGLELDTLAVVVEKQGALVRVDELEATGALGALTAAGTLEIPERSAPAPAEWRIALERLAVTRSGVAFELQQPVEITLADGRARASGLELAGSAGVLSATFDVAPSAGDVRARFERFDPEPLLPPRIAAEVGITGIGGDFEAHWSPDGVRFALAGEVAAIEIGPDRPPARLTFDVRLADERLTIEDLSLRSGRDLLLEVHGEAPLVTRGKLGPGDGPLALSAHLALPDLADVALPSVRERMRGLGLAGNLEGVVDLSGTWSDVQGTVALSSSAFVLRDAQGGALLPESAIRVRLDLGPTIAIEEASIDGPGDLDLVVEGRIDARPDLAALWTRGSAAYADAALDLAARVDAVDLARLEDLLPALRRLGGTARGELSARGTLSDPKLGGRLSIEEGELRATSSLPSIAGVSASIVLTGETIRIESFEGESGGAPFHLGGVVTLSGPGRGVDLDFGGENVLVHRAAGVRVRADAELELSGPFDALVLAGELVLKDSRFTRDFDFLGLGSGAAGGASARGLRLFSFDEPPFSTMRFDVAITSAEPFRIDNNMARGGLRPDLVLTGTGELPVLRGRVFVEPTRVSLPATTVFVRSGTVDFLPSQPDVPAIELLAEARMYGYDITIRVSGPYDRPVVDLSSVPPLGREDLVLLVLTGRPPGEDWTQRTGTRAAQDIAVYFAKDFFTGAFSSAEDGGGESFADRIEVLQGEDVSRTGVTTTQVRFRSAEGVLLENDALYLVGERDVYEHYNFGLRVSFRFP